MFEEAEFPMRLLEGASLTGFAQPKSLEGPSAMTQTVNDMRRLHADHHEGGYEQDERT